MAVSGTHRYGLSGVNRVAVVTLDIVGSRVVAVSRGCLLAGSLAVEGVAVSGANRYGLAGVNRVAVVTLDIVGSGVVAVSGACLLVGSLAVEGVAVGGAVLSAAVLAHRLALAGSGAAGAGFSSVHQLAAASQHLLVGAVVVGGVLENGGVVVAVGHQLVDRVVGRVAGHGGQIVLAVLRRGRALGGCPADELIVVAVVGSIGQVNGACVLGLIVPVKVLGNLVAIHVPGDLEALFGQGRVVGLVALGHGRGEAPAGEVMAFGNGVAGSGDGRAHSHSGGGVGFAIDLPGNGVLGRRSRAILAQAGVPAVVDSAVSIGGILTCAGGVQHGAVAVLQLDGSQRNKVVTGPTLVIHIAQHILTGTVDHGDFTGLFGGDHIGAAADNGEVLIDRIGPGNGTVQEAVANNFTVDIKGHIGQICLSTILAGRTRILDSAEFHGGMNKVHVADSFQGIHIQGLGPVLTVKDLNHITAGSNNVTGSFGVSQIQNCTLIKGQAGSGQHHDVLLDGGDAGMQIDADIVGNRQHKGTGIDGRTAQFQIHGGNSTVAVGMHFQHVSRRVIVLHEIGTGFRLEHSIRTNKLHSCTVAHVGQKDGGSNVLSRTVLVGGSYFHILHIILAQREHEELGCQLRSNGAAAEVHNLEVLVDGCAILGGDGTVTIHITPAVEVGSAVQVNMGTGKHIDIAKFTGGAAAVHTGFTAGCGMTAAHFDITIDSDLGIGSQSQSSVGCRRFPCNMTAIGDIA